MIGLAANTAHWDAYKDWLKDSAFWEENAIPSEAGPPDAVIEFLESAASWFFYSVEDELIGYSGLGWVGEGYQMSMYIRPDWRGRGYGKLMQADMIKRAGEMDMGPLIQRILPTNGAMLALSLTTGFELVGMFGEYVELRR